MKKFIAGFLSAIVLTTAINASAQINAFLADATKIQLNGKILELKDANNKTIYPINYDGSIYLPVRAISQNLGLYVDYDNTTKTVLLSEDRISKEKFYKANEPWKVDDAWELVVHSAEYVDFYNSFEKEQPKKLVMIRYSYKITGKKGVRIGGTAFVPERTAYTNEGNDVTAKRYPMVVPSQLKGKLGNLKEFSHITAGQSLDNVYAGFGLSDEADTIRVTFEQRDRDGNKYSADFVLDIEDKK